MNSGMELFRQLARLGTFKRNDLVEMTGSQASAAWHISKLLKDGNIERIRRDYYAVIDPATGASISNRFQIASHIADDACLSHHSAFEYYGCANQVYREVLYTASKRIAYFAYGHMGYSWVGRNTHGFVEENYDGVRVTTLERTVIDNIADCDRLYGSGIEEVLKCILATPPLHPDALLEVLDAFGNGTLYQKAGYIFETFQEDLILPDSLLDEMERHCPASRTYFSPSMRGCKYNPRWRIYAPDLLKIISKGVDLDADY